jgi:succinate dehydrogenase/fumarate reductase flavoprotein subunit
MSEDLECDLLVVGSGAGGLSAAVTAACHGLKVIVAEK